MSHTRWGPTRIPPQLEKNHVVPTAWQDEALARDVPQTHSRPGQAVKSLSFVREEQLPSLGTGRHGLVQSLHNHCLVTLAWRE